MPKVRMLFDRSSVFATISGKIGNFSTYGVERCIDVYILGLKDLIFPHMIESGFQNAI